MKLFSVKIVRMGHYRYRRGSLGAVVLIGLALLPSSSGTIAADPVVGWQDVQAAVDSVDATVKKSGRPASTIPGISGDLVSVRPGPGLPPPPRGRSAAISDRIHPSALAGVSSSIVPAVTGDLYWSRPELDMRIIGQSIGQNSSLRLSRPPVGVSVGSTSIKPVLVGTK